MINSCQVPQIPGDLDALAEHASSLKAAGAGFADTGADVHATWQRLTPIYIAPESGELLRATAPVKQISAQIGRDLEAVAAALSTYAETVKPIKERLASLQTQAQTFVASLDGDDNWRDDGDKVDKNNELISQVNQAMDEWMDAQRTCANSITALYGGTYYVPDNGDGRQAPNEFGYSANQLNAAAANEDGLPWGTKDQEDKGLFAGIGHGILDVGGLVPVVGEVADGANALWYLAEGDKLNAGLSGMGMIPFLGWGATGGKAIGKGIKAVKGGEKAIEVGKSLPPPRQLVATPRGTTFDIPAGWQSRTADNGKGIVYQRPGALGDADSIRIMEPTPQYPNGYFVYYNSHGQPLDINGKPGPRSATHIPEGFSGAIKEWPK